MRERGKRVEGVRARQAKDVAAGRPKEGPKRPRETVLTHL